MPLCTPISMLGALWHTIFNVKVHHPSGFEAQSPTLRRGYKGYATLILCRTCSAYRISILSLYKQSKPAPNLFQGKA